MVFLFMAANDDTENELDADDAIFQTAPIILDVPNENGDPAAISFHLELRLVLPTNKDHRWG